MNENLPGFVRCVHPKRNGAEWFAEATANSKSWQRSTGWIPQPLPEAITPSKEETTKEPEFKQPSEFKATEAQGSTTETPKAKQGRPRKTETA